MASMATDLAKSILEKLINATIEQSRYICCFTFIVEDFEKEKETLKAKRKTMGEYVKVANRRAESIRRDVTFWQEQADELIEEDTKTKVTCFFGWCPNCKWQYSRGMELAYKTEEIKRLIMENNFESVGIIRDVPDVEYHSSQNYISFKSRELKFEELLGALTDGNNYMTGLQGMGGTGKTTLAKEVGKALKKSKKFDQVIDTTISYTLDIKKIQDDIAGPLGLKSLKDCTKSERPRRLWSRLTNGEKILIILDDVWGDINFEEIGIPFKDNHNGCRVLVTTRNLRICNKMGCDKIVQLEVLPEEDAWILFKKHAGLSDNSSKSIIDKARKIVKECKGLPIAIAVIASSLNGQQHLEEWNVALKSLRRSKPLHGDEENWGKIYKCLRYSYDNMKNKTAKELFLLCSMFREDEEISDEILSRLSIGVGIVEKIDDDDDYNYNACRNEVVVAKNKLIDSCLLLKGKYGRVKMHDLVREVALWIANKEIQAVNTSNKNEKSLVEKVKNIKYLLCEGKAMDVFSFRFDGSKLEILIVYLDKENDHVEVPNSFFENVTGLRVFYLSIKTWRKSTLSLPQSIQSLTNVSSLYLEQFVLGDISILGNIQGLETLELIRCLLDELPREIANLEKLKLLKLHNCEFKRNNSFEVIESCSSLEELYFINTLRIDSSTMHQNVKLPKLQRFRIVDLIPLCGLPLFFLEEDPLVRSCLCVSKVDAFFFEETFKHLMQITEFLLLVGLQGEWTNLIPEIIFPEDEGTHNLIQLCLESISQFQCLIDTKHIGSCVQNVFSKLAVLKLIKMENLKEICSDSLPFELLKSLESLHIEDCKHLQGILFKSKLSLCNLKYLSLINCPMLTSLFQLSTTQSLVLLEKLWIKNCEQLKSLITGERKREDLGEEIVDGNNDNKSGGSMFPNLRILDIERCPQLHFILPVVATRDVPKLEEIKIRDCVELAYIFGLYQHKYGEQDLHQELKDVIFITLKKVVLACLPNFVDIFPECDQSMCSSVKRSSSKNDSKAQIESDPFKCNNFPWIHKYRHKLKTSKIPSESKDQLQDCSLSSVDDSKVNDVIGQEMSVILENIQLGDMPQMTCPFVGPKFYFTLQNVTWLIIGQCEKMKVIFSASMLECLPQLHTLDIFGCNELIHIIGEDTKNRRMPFFPRLKVLVIRECNNLKCLFPISTSEMLPELELLVIIEASMLEEVFKCDNDKKVEFPNLKAAVFVGLPSLCQANEFQIVKDCLVKNCPKFSLTSTITPKRFEDIINSSIQEGIGAWEIKRYIKKKLEETLDDLNEDSKAQEKEMSNQNPTAKATEDFPIETEVHAASGSELTSPQVNANQSIDANVLEYNQQENGIESNEFVDVVKQSKETLEEEQEFVEKAPGFEVPSTTILPTDSELIRKPPPNPSDIPLNKTHSLEIKTTVEEGITSCGKKIASPIGSESVSSLLGPFVTSECKIDPEENGEGQIAIPSLSIVNIEPATKKDVSDGDIKETSKSEDSKVQESSNQNQTAKATKDFPIGTNAQAASGSELTLSQCLKEIEDQSTQEGSMSEKSLIARETSWEPLSTPPQKGIKTSFEEGTTTTSAFAEAITSLTSLESEHGEDQIVVPSFSVVNTEFATTKDVGVGDVQETSKSMITHFETNNSPDNLSQITEDSSFASIVTRELEQLVSNKHLALENLSLLTNFLVKHPSVCLTDKTLSDRYKGFAYTCLAELLKFLQTHSVLDVLGSSHSEFVELLQDVRRFAFDRDWLDGVERRALFPGLPLSEDALQKLLHSKHSLIQHLEDVKHQLEESITQQEAQVLEVRATLSTPLGY